jgi:hypothetical protein
MVFLEFFSGHSLFYIFKHLFLRAGPRTQVPSPPPKKKKSSFENPLFRCYIELHSASDRLTLLQGHYQILFQLKGPEPFRISGGGGIQAPKVRIVVAL